MLGYDLQDLQDMIKSVDDAVIYIPPAQTDLSDNLKKAHSFLSGLWAEGYFDGYEG